MTIHLAISALTALAVAVMDTPAAGETPLAEGENILRYWDDTDFNRPDSAQIEQRFVEFAELVDKAASDSLRAEAFKAMSAKSVAAFDLMYDIAERTLFEPSPTHNDYLYTLYISTLPKAGVALDEYRQTIVDYRLSSLLPLMPGAEAPDMGLTLSDGRSVTLHELTHEIGEPSLLLFYEPDCDDCARLIETLSVDCAYPVIAVTMSEEGETKPLPEHWRSAVPAIDPLDMQELYFLRISPTTFIIGSDGCFMKNSLKL